MRITPISYNYYHGSHKINNNQNVKFTSISVGERVIDDFVNYLKQNNLKIIYANNHQIAPIENGFDDKIKIELRSNNPRHVQNHMKYFNTTISDDYFKARKFGMYGEGKSVREAMFDLITRHSGLEFEIPDNGKELVTFPDFFDR